MKYRVSVLVTFYNQEKYVERAIKSILEQKTDYGIKILVGDDGSTDGTRNIVKEWMKKFPEIIEIHVMERTPGKHISGFRASQNRLNLLKFVNTEFFTYLDGDDYFDYDCKIKKQVEILDNLTNMDCIACGHNVNMLYPDGKSIPITSTKIKEGKYEPVEYWNNVYFHTDSLLIRSTVIPKINKVLLENNFNDNMITFSVIQEGSVYYIPESWAVYVQTGDGIWTSGKIIVNHIRNMFLYDLCNQINPKMKRETSHRFSNTWMSLYKFRKQINMAELEPYSIEAENKKLWNSYQWIHYQELNHWSKMKLCLKALRKSWKHIVRENISKYFHYVMRK